MAGEIIRREVIRGKVVSLIGTASGMCQSLASDTVPLGSMLFNFDPMNEENFGLSDMIGDPATREHNQHEKEPFQMVYWGCKKVMLASKGDQPERPGVRTVLVSGDGETLEFVSKGVLSALDDIRMKYGDGPYDPPLPIIVRQIRLPNKFYMIKIAVAAPSLEPPKSDK